MSTPFPVFSFPAFESEDSTPETLPSAMSDATGIPLRNLTSLITSRLPKALPPHASDPSFFTTGLLYYLPFVTKNLRLYSTLPTTSPVAKILAPLMAVIARQEENLREDIMALTGWSSDALNAELIAMSATSFVGPLEKKMTSSVSTATTEDEKLAVILGYTYTILQTLILLSSSLRNKMACETSFWSLKSSTLEPVAPGLEPLVPSTTTRTPHAAQCIPTSKLYSREESLEESLEAACPLLTPSAKTAAATSASWLATCLIRTTQELDMLPVSNTSTPNSPSSLHPSGARKGHPRRAARDSVQLIREHRFSVENKERAGYNLDAGTIDILQIGVDSVPRGFDVVGELKTEKKTEEKVVNRPTRSRSIKFGAMPKKQ